MVEGLYAYRNGVTDKNDRMEQLFLRADRSNAFKLLSRPQTDVFISSGLFIGGPYQLLLHHVSWPGEKSSITLQTRDPPTKRLHVKGKTENEWKEKVPSRSRFQPNEFARHPGMNYGSLWSSGNYKQEPLGRPPLQAACTGPLCIS